MTENSALNAAYDAAYEYAEAHNLDIRSPIEPMIDVAIDAWATAKHQDNGTTHWEGCWKAGTAHYGCALAEIERMKKELKWP